MATAAPPQILTTIEEMFRCFICLGRVEGAVMCPSCSKFSCTLCMATWLADHPTCPHCRAALTLDTTVPCRFLNDLSDELDKARASSASPSASPSRPSPSSHAAPPAASSSSAPPSHAAPLRERCPLHPDLDMQYFCETCSLPLCSDCAMFGSRHAGHAFNKLDAVYSIHVSRVRLEMAAFVERVNSLHAAMRAVEANIEDVTRAREERALEIAEAVEQMHARLEAELKAKLLALLSQKGSLAEELSLLDTMLGELERQLATAPRSVLIAKTDELLDLLGELAARPTAPLLHAPVAPHFDSELVPPYAGGIFVLRSFAAVRAAQDVVYSDPLLVDGVAWRLKVYPNGNGVAQGTHLSVFLEMGPGLAEPAKYEYRVEMVHPPPDARPPVVREYVSAFEALECWGYNKYVRLDSLDRDGFVVDDALTFNFFVRPVTYYQKAADQARYIAVLEADRAHLRSLLDAPEPASLSPSHDASPPPPLPPALLHPTPSTDAPPSTPPTHPPPPPPLSSTPPPAPSHSSSPTFTSSSDDDCSLPLPPSSSPPRPPVRRSLAPAIAPFTFSNSSSDDDNASPPAPSPALDPSHTSNDLVPLLLPLALPLTQPDDDLDSPSLHAPASPPPPPVPSPPPALPAPSPPRRPPSPHPPSIFSSPRA